MTRKEFYARLVISLAAVHANENVVLDKVHRLMAEAENDWMTYQGSALFDDSEPEPKKDPETEHVNACEYGLEIDLYSGHTTKSELIADTDIQATIKAESIFGNYVGARRWRLYRDGKCINMG